MPHIDASSPFPRRLAATIAYWLAYQDLNGRDTLLSESFLSQPIGELLRNEAAPGDVVAEFNHPRFLHAGRGRPRQIDFVTRSRTGTLRMAIETKWVVDRPEGLQRIFDDLLRLETLSSRGIRRYFVLAGTHNGLANHFFNLGIRPGTGTTVRPMQCLFPQTVGQRKRIALKVPDFLWLKDYGVAFYEAYRVPLPSSVDLTAEADELAGRFRVLVWKVEGTKGAGRHFNPHTVWKQLVPSAEEEHVV